MGITKFIEKLCVQTAVYWGSPVPNGYGGKTYDPPREILCRWQDTEKVIADAKGVQVVCKAEIMVSEDLDEQGMIYLGALDEITAAQEADPLLLTGAYEIKQFDKTPMIFSTTEFVRKAYL
jgi:hypothetical protein